jgi:adenylylsulfate kinase
LTPILSPYRKDRQTARALYNDDSFIEVFVDCPLKVCEERDPKGIYKKARQGIIKDFTGIDAPYEPPENPEIHLHTDLMSVKECVEVIISYLIADKYIPA